MESVVLVIHLILALMIIGLVLLQRSEGGGLGIGGSSGGGLGGLASAKGTANALTKMTGYCAAGFFITSLTLGVLAGQNSRINQNILEDIAVPEIVAPIAEGVVAPVADVEAPVLDLESTPIEEMVAPVVEDFPKILEDLPIEPIKPTSTE